MKAQQANTIHDRLAYSGEQVLSYLDEIVRSECPKCGLSDLNISIIGKSLVIRCCEALSNYSDELEMNLNTCDFVKVIKPVSMTNIKFTDEVKPRRATAQNRKATRKRRTPR